MGFQRLSIFQTILTKALFAAFVTVLCALPVMAQDAPVTAAPAPVATPAPAQQARNFQADVRAVDAETLMSGQTPIKLWAIEKVDAQSAAFDLKARVALDNAIAQKKVVCEAKGRDGANLLAQCTNATDQDLSLFMVQQGFATVDRQAVYGTVFEDAYIQAEMQAQGRGVGVWGDQAGEGEGGGDSNLFMASFGFILFLCITAAFIVITVIIMRGFKKVIDAQNQNADMMARERKVREKERGIVAIMLDSELKANKSKIEAYLVVYEEMLRGLKESDRTPRYKKAGDIIQKQPALARSVFDRNTDKLDMLGELLSSELVHFYARIKTSPDYINLEPSTPIEEAIAILDGVLAGARRLNDIADKLLTSFAENGIVSEDFQE